MKMNIKTKVTKLRHEGGMLNITNCEKVEQLRKFRYLGVLITGDRGCEVEIRTRIAMAKRAFGKRRELII